MSKSISSIIYSLPQACQSIVTSISWCTKASFESIGRVWNVLTQSASDCVAKVVASYSSIFAKTQNIQEVTARRPSIQNKKIIILAYCPFLKSYPETINAIEYIVRTAFGGDIQIKHQEINENSPKTQQVTEDRILLFSMNESKRPDDANNYKNFFNPKRRGVAAVALVRPRDSVLVNDFAFYFKKASCVISPNLDSQEAMIQKLREKYAHLISD